MSKCHVCDQPTEENCHSCGQPVCSNHSSAKAHNCTETTNVNVVQGNRTNVRIEDSVAHTVNIGGSNNSDTEHGFDQLEKAVRLKTQMDSPSINSDSQRPNAALVAKALEQASDLKASAVNPESDREELLRRINRLSTLIDESENISGGKLEDVEDAHAVLQDLKKPSLSHKERIRLRDAMASLEDELHVLL
ncbi:hypothetical protein GOC74_00040 [Halomicrobium mukohataei]|uniref:AN1-type domain-containing protein n=1 Tax=Halomicrobium mukohataei TaxID=57705 RepID=A0A847U5Q9_9EURY|nr:hypothetical protein [Halomicrobium mukohataei]NLV08339.1 hypothetical protein [Halomicrobium mukohataei]